MNIYICIYIFRVNEELGRKKEKEGEGRMKEKEQIYGMELSVGDTYLVPSGE